MGKGKVQGGLEKKALGPFVKHEERRRGCLLMVPKVCSPVEEEGIPFPPSLRPFVYSASSGHFTVEKTELEFKANSLNLPAC